MPRNEQVDASSPDPLKTIKDAAKAVPAVRYALGVVGVAAAGSLIRAYFSSTRLAVYTTIAVLGLMVLLWGFAQLARLPAKWLKYPALVLAWVVFIAFASLPVLLISSVCFNWPKPFAEFRRTFVGGDPATGDTSLAQVHGSSKFAGTITDARTRKAIEGVQIRLSSGGPILTTTSSTGFYEFLLPKPPIGRVAIIYQATGYQALTESVYPSETLDFQLRRQ